MPLPRTRYATTADGLSIAYQDIGGSGPDLVWVTGTASHVELFWDLPGWSHTMRRLSSFSRVVWFDKRGTGLSDRSIGTSSLEDRMEDIRAVMDELDIASAVVVGASESGALTALFAATFPERVQQLILLASWAFDPRGEKTAARYIEALEELWGTGVLLEMMWARGIVDTDLLARIERALGSPSTMVALARANATIDVRSVLPLIQAPTLVLHCTHDPIISVHRGRELAAAIPGAELVEIDADFHASGLPREMDLYGDPIQRFVTGTAVQFEPADRVLSTVLFTDIVGSTDLAVEIGDGRWAELLDDHDRVCARAVEHGRGRIVKATGDGVLATFDGPANAIKAGRNMIQNLRALGLEIRAGVHTGEVERRGEDIGGVGVNLAARIMATTPAGEVWVSSTVPGLTVGAEITFESRGRHGLKGIPDEWELFAAVAG